MNSSATLAASLIFSLSSYEGIKIIKASHNQTGNMKSISRTFEIALASVILTGSMFAAIVYEFQLTILVVDVDCV